MSGWRRFLLELLEVATVALIAGVTTTVGEEIAYRGMEAAEKAMKPKCKKRAKKKGKKKS